MSRAHFRDSALALTSLGELAHVPGATITVYTEGTTTLLPETLYDAVTGVGTKANPFLAADDGTYDFWLAAAKNVNVKVSKTGYTTVTLPSMPVWHNQGDVIDKTSSQTLQNKELSSPVITEPSISGGSATGLALTSPTLTSPVMTGPTITNPSVNVTDELVWSVDGIEAMRLEDRGSGDGRLYLGDPLANTPCPPFWADGGSGEVRAHHFTSNALNNPGQFNANRYDTVLGSEQFGVPANLSVGRAGMRSSVFVHAHWGGAIQDGSSPGVVDAFQFARILGTTSSEHDVGPGSYPSALGFETTAPGSVDYNQSEGAWLSWYQNWLIGYPRTITDPGYRLAVRKSPGNSSAQIALFAHGSNPLDTEVGGKLIHDWTFRATSNNGSSFVDAIGAQFEVAKLEDYFNVSGTNNNDAKYTIRLPANGALTDVLVLNAGAGTATFQAGAIAAAALTPGSIDHTYMVNRNRLVPGTGIGNFHDAGDSGAAVLTHAGVSSSWWNMPDGARTAVSCEFPVPNDWSSGALSIVVLWAPGGATGGNVGFQVAYEEFVPGSVIGNTLGTVQAHAAPTVTNEVKASLMGQTITPSAAGRMVRVTIRRVSDDAADTLAQTVKFFGALITYLADM